MTKDPLYGLTRPVLKRLLRESQRRVADLEWELSGRESGSGNVGFPTASTKLEGPEPKAAANPANLTGKVPITRQDAVSPVSVPKTT